MRHQMSERAVNPDSNNQENGENLSNLPHSKSVPNLTNNNSNSGTGEDAPGTPSADETSFSYLDPDKRLRVTDNTLKLIQKQALLDYYERHNASGNPVKRSPSQSRQKEPDSGFYSPISGETQAGSRSGSKEANVGGKSADSVIVEERVEIHRADDEDGENDDDKVGPRFSIGSC